VRNRKKRPPVLKKEDIYNICKNEMELKDTLMYFLLAFLAI
jgi:hypothetical protein